MRGDDKFLVFSDLHAHTHTRYSSRGRSGNSRLDVALDVLKQMLNHCLAEGINKVIFAGDLFDAKARVPVRVLNAVSEEIETWGYFGINVLMIPGNHDYLVRSGEHHALEVLSVHRNVTIVGRVMLIDWYGLRVKCIPYQEENDPFIFMATEGADILVAHGCAEGMCHIPRALPEDPGAPDGEWIREEWLRGYKLSIIGHVHEPEERTRGAAWTIVPGCPYQDNPHFREAQRGFWEVDWEKKTARMIESKAERFIRILIKEGKLEESKDIDGNVIRVIPTGRETPLEIRDAVASLYDAGASFVEVCKPEVSKDKKPDAPRLQIGEADSVQDVFRRALGSELFDLKEEDTEAVLKRGLEILGSIQTK